MSDMPGPPADDPISVHPFTLRRLMEHLTELSNAGDVNPDTLVFAAVQPTYPYAFPLCDLVADPPLPEEDWPGAVYLAVGRCAGRLDPEVRREFGWAALPPRQSDPADPSTYTAHRDTAPPSAPSPRAELPAAPASTSRTSTRKKR